MYSKKTCQKDDIRRVRDFLSETYKIHQEKRNWLIDRLNFTYSLSRIMNGIDEVTYRNKMLIVEKNKVIEAVVLTEGEDRGEAFFQLRNLNCDDTLIKIMFDFVEDNLMKEEEGESYVHLRIQREAVGCVDEAIKRGYIKENWTEITSKKTLETVEEVRLKDGYRFAQIDEVSDAEKAIGHAEAFGYIDKPVYLERSKVGIGVLEKMLDFDNALDIQVLDIEDKVVAFCTMWFDKMNKIGILEPVGTHPEHRRKGLAKAAIFEACNRIYKRGAKAVYVGSDQEFYKAIGFEEKTYDDVYKKCKKGC